MNDSEKGDELEIIGPNDPEPPTKAQAARTAIAAALIGVDSKMFPLPWRVDRYPCCTLQSANGRAVAVASSEALARLIVEAVNGAPAMLEELERWSFDREDGVWFCPSCVAEHNLDGEEPAGPGIEHAPTLPCAAPVDAHDPNPLTPEPDANEAKVGAP